MARGLGRDERLILILYYHEKMNQREIGEVIGLTESMISKMHRDILKRLRRRLTGGARMDLSEVVDGRKF